MKELQIGSIPVKRCDDTHSCVSREKDFTTLNNETLFLEDYRMPVSDAQRNELVSVLRSIGFLEDSEGYREFERYITRLLWNPSRLLMKEIRKERRRIGSTKYQVGVHIRCAGLLADIHEGVAIVTPEILSTVPSRIERLLNQSNIPRNLVYVYLSTDSSIAYKKISESVSPVPVKSTSLYKRGHTTDFRVNSDAVKRAFIDLFLIAQSQYLLLTKNSGFSMMIDWLNSYSHVFYISASYSKILKGNSTI